MAEQLIFCADNLFSATQYPSHTVTGQEEATGYEAYHVATGRRHTTDAWRPTTSNASRYVQVLGNQLRGATFCAVDRNSNLLSNARAGNTSTIALTGSDDSFTSSRSLWSVTLPTVPGGLPSGATGCVTDEDVWVKTWAADAFYGWRLTVSAMGSGVTPSLGGLWVGRAWQPSSYQVSYPLADEAYDIATQEARSLFGWVGRSRYSAVRRGVIRITPSNEDDYDMIRWQVLGLFARGRPAWIVMQSTDRPQRALLARCPAGMLTHELDSGYHKTLRTVSIPFEEEQPA